MAAKTVSSDSLPTLYWGKSHSLTISVTLLAYKFLFHKGLVLELPPRPGKRCAPNVLEAASVQPLADSIHHLATGAIYKLLPHPHQEIVTLKFQQPVQTVFPNAPWLIDRFPRILRPTERFHGLASQLS